MSDNDKVEAAKTWSEKIRIAEHRICGKCTHEKCGTVVCPLTYVTDDELLNYYEYGQFSV